MSDIKFQPRPPDDRNDLFGRVDNIVGVAVAQFLDGAESPRHATGVYTGPAGSFHVDTGISDIEHFGFAWRAFGEDFKDDRGIWFGRHTFLVALYRFPVDVREIVPDERYHGRLIFV